MSPSKSTFTQLDQAIERIWSQITSELADVATKLGNDLSHLQNETQTRLTKVQRMVDTFRLQMVPKAARYFTLKGDVIVFTNTKDLATDINKGIAQTREAAKYMSELAKMASQRIVTTTLSCEAEFAKVIVSAETEFLKVAGQADVVALRVLFDKVEYLKNQGPDSMVRVMLQQIVAGMTPMLVEVIKNLSAEANGSVRRTAKKVVAEARKAATDAAAFEESVKSKTPGPMKVQAGVYAVLESNGFNWRKRRFEYQGYIGPVTRVANRFINSKLSGAEEMLRKKAVEGATAAVAQKAAAAKSNASVSAISFMIETISGQLTRVGIPEVEAGKVAETIVMGLASKF